MRFLCQTHTDLYLTKPDEDISQRWVEWMYNAAVHYENTDWKQALVFVGSAFDLARLRVREPRRCGKDGVVQVALSGIYLANVFDHLHHPEEARHVRWLASDCLSNVHSALDLAGKAECNTCRRYLYDHERQGRFVQHYLNIPFEPCNSRKTALLH